MENTLWINEQEVSRITGRAAQTLRNDRHKRQGLPYSKIGRSVRYKLDDVIRYLHNQAAKGGKRVLIGTRWLFRKSPEKLNDFYNANSYLTNNHFSIDLWLQPTTSKKIFANYGFRAASKRHRWSNTISATD